MEKGLFRMKNMKGAERMILDGNGQDYHQIIHGIKQRTVGIILYKNDRVTLYRESFDRNKWASLLILLPFVLPISFILGYVWVTKNYAGLVAIPFYLVFPFILPQSYLLSMFLTGLGLFGLVWKWPPFALCLLIPAMLSFWGERIWWSTVQIIIVRELMKNQNLFDTLWKKGLVAIHDFHGSIYKYNANQVD